MAELVCWYDQGGWNSYKPKRVCAWAVKKALQTLTIKDKKLEWVDGPCGGWSNPGRAGLSCTKELY